MYGVGAAVGIPVLVASRGKITPTELLWGVGLCSFDGNLSTLRALKFLPAETAFPIVVGGHTSILALCSWLFLDERLRASAKLEIICRAAAIALVTI
jgi:multidrug transporter EmrE-like cation transporter